MADIGCITRQRLQCGEISLVRFGVRPAQPDDGIMRARGGKAAWLATAQSRQDALGVLLLVAPRVVGRNKNEEPLCVAPHPTREAAVRGNFPTIRVPVVLLVFRPAQPNWRRERRRYGRASAASPARRCRGLWRQTKRPTDIRSQELDSFWLVPSSSPPSSARASFWLSRTISTSLS